MTPKTVLTTKPFKKQLKKLSVKVQSAFAKRLELLMTHRSHVALRVHKLTGEFEGLHSFNVTGDVRVVFDDRGEEIVILIAIGSHSQLYR